MLTKIKDTAMLSLCALMLAGLFLMFAFLALFSGTIKWAIDESMNKLADVLSEAEKRSIAKHRQPSF